ncbi:MAG: pyridoxine 5'-phosphate synthase [Myxococcales bacterium]|nr:pyridoxine 5'-phosphate synthase [Myxococcales bacterium]
MSVRLQVNVDHVATLRQARGASYPDPIRVAELSELAGVDGITVHLREDRRHIQDEDVLRLRKVVRKLNLEMAATPAMLTFAQRARPNTVTLVPERREEKTTEGGLDVAGHRVVIAEICAELSKTAIAPYVFIDPDAIQVQGALDIGCAGVEFHTGDFANASGESQVREQLARLQSAARKLTDQSPALVVAAGHGLTLGNVELLVREVPQLGELNIGHAMIGDAIILGIQQAVCAFRRAIQNGQRGRRMPEDRS